MFTITQLANAAKKFPDVVSAERARRAQIAPPPSLADAIKSQRDKSTVVDFLKKAIPPVAPPK